MRKSASSRRRLERILMACMVGVLLSACSGNHGDSLQQAKSERAAGRFDAALIALKQHLADSPNSAEGRFLMADVLIQGRNPRAAEVELRKAKDLGFPPDKVVPALAYAMLMQGQFAKLIAEFESVSLGDPIAKGELLALLADAYLSEGHPDKATDLATKALASAPELARATIILARLSAIAGDMPAALGRLDAFLAKRADNADVWQTKGEVLQFGRKDLDGAAKAFEKSIEVRKDQYSAVLALARVHLQRQDAPAAAAALAKLKAVAPMHPQTRFIEARLAYLSEDYARSRSLVQGLLQQAPDDPSFLSFSGALALRTKELILGETHLARAVQLSPTANLSRLLLAQTRLLMGRPAAAYADLQPLLDAAGANVTALSLGAQAQLQLGDFALADQLFRRALSAKPKDVSLRTTVAVSRLTRGRADEAIAELESVAREEPGDTAALALVGAQMRRGEVAAALAQVDALIAKNPKSAAYQNLRARVLLADGKSDEARARFEQAATLEPGFFPPIQSLVLLDAAKHDMPAVIKRLDVFIKSYPRHAEARMALVEAMIDQKRPKNDVAKALEEIIRIDPAFLPARLKLIDLHLAANSPAQAVTVAQAALLANPGRPELLSALGRAQVAAGELQQAQSTLSKLVAMSPQSVEPLLQLADVQVLTKNIPGATSSMRHALDIAPNNQEVRRRLMAISMANKEPDKAIGFARDMQRRSPQLAAGYLLEAEVAADRKDWAAAAASLKAGLAAGAEPSAKLAARLYIALVLLGKQPEAEQLVATRTKREPADADFLIRVAELLMLRGQLPEAERFFMTSLQYRPSDASAENNVAWILLKLGKPGALAHAERAVQLSKESPSMLDTQALALAADGQIDKAIDASAKALGKSPESPTIRLTLAKLLVKAKQWEKAKEQVEQLRSLKAPFEGSKELPDLLAEIERKR